MTNLVARGIPQSGKQRGELAAERCSCVLLENNLVESTRRCDLEASRSVTMTAHAIQLKCVLTLVWLLINRFAVVST